MSDSSPRAAARSGPRRRGRAPVDVVLAEEHEAMRQALRMVLDAEPALSVVAQAGEIARTVALVHSYHPDVLVLDLRMGNDSTLATVQRLRSEAPETQVVIITMGEGRAFATRSHEAGAIGFVMKDRADADLVEAVQRAARGEEFTSPSMSPGL